MKSKVAGCGSVSTVISSIVLLCVSSILIIIIILKNLTQKKARHEPSVWAMSTKCCFNEKENKLDYCRRKD